jgi:hypothetical protein
LRTKLFLHSAVLSTHSVHVSVMYNICLLSNAKMYHYYMNLLWLYVCILFSYVLAWPLHTCVPPSGVYVTCMGDKCDCSHLYIFSGDVCAVICRKVHVKSEIWSCMCQCICHSYASYSYWFYKCDIFLRYSMSALPSCPCLAWRWSSRAATCSKGLWF